MKLGVQRRFLKPETVRARAGGISKMTEFRWRKAGILPEPVKICGHNYYDEAEIDRAFEQMAQAEPEASPE